MSSLYSTEELPELRFHVQDIDGLVKVNTSIGICAHNEERNIGKLLDALLEQRSNIARIVQILVISYSTDATNKVVERYKRKDSRVKLVLQKKREGKASAVNLFLRDAIGDVLVLESADTLPKNSTIEKIVEPFLDSNVGMVGGRPIPTNNHGKFMGVVSSFLWKLHHEVSAADLENPKCGEVIAFRNIIQNIPNDTAVDEAWIEMAVRKKGFSLRYAPDAIVYNHGPESVSDFLKQRRRIYSGHLYLKNKAGYKVSTMNVTRILKAVPRVIGHNWREVIFFAGAVFLELYGRFLGAYDYYVKKKNPYVWDMVASTKEL
jgi:biofilm PGA synthesis N-glycosyltransferase PgaC